MSGYVSDEEVRELRDLWLSRLMFNMFVGWPPETRTFDEFVAAASRPAADTGGASK